MGFALFLRSIYESAYGSRHTLPPLACLTAVRRNLGKGTGLVASPGICVEPREQHQNVAVLCVWAGFRRKIVCSNLGRKV
jgi:hypothetical protein